MFVRLSKNRIAYSWKKITRLVRLPQEMMALVSLAGLAKAARVRRLGIQRRGGRRDPKLSG